MKTHALLSALGRDRIGVADDLAAALTKGRMDIKDSRMTSLRGQFALIVHVCGKKDDVTSLHRDLPTLGTHLGFDLQLNLIDPVLPSGMAGRFSIEAFSSGPAALNAVTGLLKRYDVNIQDLETEAFEGPWTRAIMFHMKAHITLPPSCSIETLRGELRQMESERKLEIRLEPGPPETSPAQP